MQFDVTINTPRGLYKQTKASIINVVSPEGQRGILPNHAPIVVSLAISRLTMVEDGHRETYAVSGGVLYFRDNVCTVLTRSIEHVDEIDLQRSLESKARAEERLSRPDDDTVDLARARNALARAENRIRVKTEG